MNARYIQRGDSIDYTPAANVAAGDIIKVGNLVGVAKLDIAANELGALALVGVYAVTKGTTAFAMGDAVGWDATNKKAVAASMAGAIPLGTAIATAAATDSTVAVRLG